MRLCACVAVCVFVCVCAPFYHRTRGCLCKCGVAAGRGPRREPALAVAHTTTVQHKTLNCVAGALPLLLPLPPPLQVVYNVVVGGYFSIKRNIMSIPLGCSITQDQLMPFTEALLRVFR